MSSMTKRERVLTAFSRKTPDRVPYWIQSGSYLSQIVKEKTGSDNSAEYFDIDIPQYVYYGPTKNQGDFSKYPSWSGKYTNEWGQGSCPPMIDFKTADDVYEYPFPDVGASYRYEHLPEAVQRVKEKGLPAVSGYECGSFEHLWALRGMNYFLADLLDEPEFLTPLIEKVSDLKAEIAAGYAKAGVDIVWTGDDLGSEISMLMSPEVWRKHLKPCVKKIVKKAKEANPNVMMAFHSDGYMEPIIADLIEVGIDILQAVQPECMDLVKLKEEYGDGISFWGTMGTQSTMAFGTPEEVRAVVEERIMTVGKGGGLCIGPSHTLEAPTPWENIVAFIEAVNTFGKYS